MTDLEHLERVALAATPAPASPSRPVEAVPVAWPGEEAVERAASVLWDDFHGRMGGEWPGKDSELIVVVQCMATARAALRAASPPPREPEGMDAATVTVPDTTGLVERLRDRAEAERKIQRNNEAVAAALAGQLEAFERRDGTHNTFAVRLGLEYRDCAKRDAELARDWDEAAAALERQASKLRAAEAALAEAREALTKRANWREHVRERFERIRHGDYPVSDMSIDSALTFIALFDLPHGGLATIDDDGLAVIEFADLDQNSFVDFTFQSDGSAKVFVLDHRARQASEPTRDAPTFYMSPEQRADYEDAIARAARALSQQGER